MFLPEYFHLTFRAILAGGFGLLLSASLVMAEPNSLQSGRQALEQGNFAAALAIFQSLSQQQPGDPEVDFLLGRSAYETGDFETAIFAFERVLILQPEAQRARLELARSYFSVGDLQSARSNFQAVLDRQPPLVVRNNIQRYLRLIDQAAQQHHVSGRLSIGLAYDDNVQFSPAEEQVQTITVPITLDDAFASPEEDLINQNILELNHLYRRHPHKPGWTSSLLLYNSNYRREEDLNLNLIGLSSGPVWQRGNWQHKLQARANYMTLGGDRYLSSIALSFEPGYQLNRSQSLNFMVQATLLDFATRGRDSKQYRLAGQYVAGWGKNRLNLQLGLETNHADDDQYSYLRQQLAAYFERQLPWRLTGSLGGRWQRTEYDEAGPLFSEKRRDLLRELSLGLSRPLWTGADGSRQLTAQLTHVWTDNRSNIELYPYDKQVTSFALSLSF